jgi:hypothetical protein
MQQIISFSDAISATEGEDRALLLGNGFSIRHFSYKNLLSVAGIEDESPLMRLFNDFNTFDFEAVIRALEDAASVA